MTQPYDPADPRVLSQPPSPILGAPAPMYNPADIFSGDRGMSMAIVMAMPQIMAALGLGSGTFLPEQVPAQALLDQMTAAKYIQNSQLAAASFRPQDQTAIADRLQTIFQPKTELGAQQLNNFAGYINHPMGQMIASSLLGPQNAEDLFFGRRGSAVQFANSVSQFGFYRPDSVTGGERMSAASLQQFTEQIYSNLYGPKADLNDVSGLSAGRIGGMANNLAQRGLLPESTSMLSPQQQMSALRDRRNRPNDFAESIARDLADETMRLDGTTYDTPSGKKTYAQLDPESRREILQKISANPDSEFRQRADRVVQAIDDPNSTSNFQDIIDMPGGAAGVRKIDATRVSNALKEYTGAVDAVRAIFGDNGMGNAPMQQLIAALDALTQGGMSSMQPGRLENILRRTQMASKDTGVSMEALMGLTSRGGALADQYGLARDVVPDAVISAMERGGAMRDTNAFAPGFGKNDPNTAMLKSLDQIVRSDASMSSRLASTARRIVQENKGNTDFEKAPETLNLRRFVAAYERGDSTFVDENGNTVDINKEMGQNPGIFFGSMFDRAQITDQEVTARLYDEVNTQEYLLSGRAAAGQRSEMTQKLGNRFLQDFLANGMGKKLNEQERVKLASVVGTSFSTALIDEVDSNMTPAERIETLQRATQRGVEQYVRQQDPTLDDNAVQARTQELLFGPNGLFKDDADMRRYVGMEQANLGREFEGVTGENINPFRQRSRLSVLIAAEERNKRHQARADMIEAMGGSVTGDGSNFIQRISDFFLTSGVDSSGKKKSFAEYVLNTVDTQAKQEQLITAVGGRDAFNQTMQIIEDEFAASTIDTEAEKNKAVNEILSVTGDDRAKLFEENVKTRFAMSPGGANIFDGKTTVIGTDEIAKNMQTKLDSGSSGGLDTTLKEIYRQNLLETTQLAPTEIEAAVTSAFSADNRAATLKNIAGMGGLQKRITALSPNGAQIAAEIGLGANVLTEKELRQEFANRSLVAGDFTVGPNDEGVLRNKRAQERINKLNNEMAAGEIKPETILQMAEVDVADPKKQEELKTAIQEAVTDYTDADVISDPKGKFQQAIAGLDEEEKTRITRLTNLSRALRITGGMEEIGAGGARAEVQQTARLTALKTAVESGKIKADEGLGRDLTVMSDEKADPKEREAAKKRVDAVLAGKTEQEFANNLEQAAREGRGVVPTDADKRRSAAHQEIIDAAKQNEQAMGGAAGDSDGGILGQIGTAISTAFSKAMADAFKDVKIENVTISKLNIDGAALGNLFSGLSWGGSGKQESPTAQPTDTTKGDEDQKSPTQDGGSDSSAEGAQGDQGYEGAQGAPGYDSAQTSEAQKTPSNALPGMGAVAAERFVSFMSMPNAFQQENATGGGGGNKATEFTGTLTFTGLNSAIAHLIPRQPEHVPGGGAPIMPQSLYT